MENPNVNRLLIAFVFIMIIRVSKKLLGDEEFHKIAADVFSDWKSEVYDASADFNVAENIISTVLNSE